MCYLETVHDRSREPEITNLQGVTTVLVGRFAVSDIVLSYKFISRLQCGIALFPLKSHPVWIVKDGSLIDDKRNSSYGTYVNGYKLGDIEIRQLKPGDLISFANKAYPHIIFNCEKEDNNEKNSETFGCEFPEDIEQ
ncbi:FHA domain-containing protein [Nodularia phage vB_NspS-kac68v162]|jgi:pSer/pThr/pTyr-binding forkhead associated (FHA) protein|uniref:FHA domain-containing protein n=2 Tax=Ravarandavirus kac68v161 TaxID=2845690 RepID=A0A482MIV8_9CAUD|nr:FHA domain-containing protein [Nodularia phage vB_NspS-kac68v161]QBQ73741.1 FHA domain-containing protein [Nodularia phage vB_NspS-kac68v161]QBQ73937.1 FHA domain-containing protein [Nodularia phage vB_NspS-kac68v162]